MADSYLAIKSLHIIGVVLFYGNILVSSWWKGMAARNGNPRVVAFAHQQLFATDIVFTTLGAVLLLITGVGNAHMHDMIPLDSAWMSWGLWLFIVSGVIWGGLMLPIQIKQAQIIKRFDLNAPVPQEFWRLERWWTWIGAFAKLLPLTIIVIMVFKPE